MRVIEADNKKLRNIYYRLYIVMEFFFKGLAVLAALATSGIVVIIGASVSMRYFALTPLHFTEELVGLLMTTAFFLALPLTTMKMQHVRISLLVSFLTEDKRDLAGKIARFFGVLFCVWFLILCVPWLEFAIEKNIKTEVGRLIMYPWMLILPISAFLTLIAFVLKKPEVESSQNRSDQVST